jgi:mycothiol system anti-sigma-R factor
MSFLDRVRRIFGGERSNGRGRGHGHDPASVTCHEALGLLYEYLDGELQGVSEEHVRAHFEVCRMCYPHLRFEESFRTAIHRAGRGERAPEKLKAHLLELLEKASAES